MLELGEFNIDLTELVEACNKHKPKRIAVQIPAAFQRHAAELSLAITDACAVDVIMVSRPTYGACDLIDSKYLKNLDVDLLANFGHAELPNIKAMFEKELELPIVFVELPVKESELRISTEDIAKLNKSVALATTVQYIHLIPKIAEVLKKQGVNTHFGEGDKRIKYSGQVLGCNYSSILALPEKNVDSYLFVGSGMFHPLGIALATNKPTFALDPHLGIIINLASQRDRFLRQRHALITSTSDAERFAVVISTKPGQFRMKLALEVRDRLKSHGKIPVMFVTDELEPSQFDYTDFDVIVSTACPRIALDDSARYKKPIITPVELEIVLGDRAWDDYYPDMIEG